MMCASPYAGWSLGKSVTVLSQGVEEQGAMSKHARAAYGAAA